jgi:hypothetical protein
MRILILGTAPAFMKGVRDEPDGHTQTRAAQYHALRDLVLSHRILDHVVHGFDKLVDLLLRELPRPAGGVLVGRRRQEPRDRAWAAAQAVSDGRWANAILRVPHESQALLISRHPWRLRRQLGL